MFSGSVGAVLTGFVAAVIVIGVLVAIHEFGHFIVAKAFGIGVPVFSIGMGPRLFGFRYGGTDYRIAALPVGGYVQLAGADPFGEQLWDTQVDPALDFMKRPVWQRLLVMFAGPAFNLMLPVVVFTAVLMGGEPQHDTTLGEVYAASPFEEAGFRVGDRVVEVNGAPVQGWADLAAALSARAGVDTPVVVERGGQRLTLTAPGAGIATKGPGLFDPDHAGISWFPASTRVGVDDPASPAAQAGLRTGDLIQTVDGEPVRAWAELQARLGHEPVSLGVLRAERGENGTLTQELTVELTPDPAAVRPGDALANPWGFYPVQVFVGAVKPDQPAAKAGIEANDRVYAVDGGPVRDWNEMLARVKAQGVPEDGALKPVRITLVRQGALIDREMTPDTLREVGLDGVSFRPVVGIVGYPDAYTDGALIERYHSFFEAVPKAFRETAIVFRLTLDALGNLVTQETSLGESVGGPVKIGTMAAQAAQRGIYAYARFIGMISISLGIVNLLPVPVLDGGQILFYLVEGIRGRPLSVALRERLQMAGVLLLVGLTLVVFVLDVEWAFTGGGG